MEDVVTRLKDKLSGKIIKFEEKSTRRIYVDFKPEDIPAAAEFVFKNLGCRLVTATGIDTPSGFEILYHFSHDSTGKVVSLRTLILDKKQPAINSITPIIRGAEWIEREMWEMLGINFIGHPNLKRLLLADEWPDGKYPLRHQQ
jgi:Ni,Fe-hydrogenase III component G